jgi:hypothetical protein
MEDRKRPAASKRGGDTDSSDESPSSDDEESGRQEATSSTLGSYYSAHIASVCEAVNAESKAPLYSPALTRLERRREANRLSAKRCRKRRREEIQQLEKEVRSLSSEQEELAAENSKLKSVFQAEISRAGIASGTERPPISHNEHLPQLSTLQRLQPGTSQTTSLRSLLQNIATPHPISQLNLNNAGFQPILPLAGIQPTATHFPPLAAASHPVVRQPQNESTLLALLSSGWPPGAASIAAPQPTTQSLGTAGNPFFTLPLITTTFPGIAWPPREAYVGPIARRAGESNNVEQHAVSEETNSSRPDINEQNPSKES